MGCGGHRMSSRGARRGEGWARWGLSDGWLDQEDTGQEYRGRDAEAERKAQKVPGLAVRESYSGSSQGTPERAGGCIPTKHQRLLPGYSTGLLGRTHHRNGRRFRGSYRGGSMTQPTGRVSRKAGTLPWLMRRSTSSRVCSVGLGSDLPMSMYQLSMRPR